MLQTLILLFQCSKNPLCKVLLYNYQKGRYIPKISTIFNLGKLLGYTISKSNPTLEGLWLHCDQPRSRPILRGIRSCLQLIVKSLGKAQCQLYLSDFFQSYQAKSFAMIVENLEDILSPFPSKDIFFFQDFLIYWYFVTKMSLEHFIQTVKGQNIFWLQNAFLTCYWNFLISNKLENQNSNCEKMIGI